MSAYGNLLDPARRQRMPLGVKADRQYHSITHNPSTIGEGETLYVRVPKLRRDVLIVPGTLKLTFDMTKKGNADNFFVNNVARSLQARVVDKLGGEILSDINYYYIYQTYKDLWLGKKKRKNMVMQGIGVENLRKLRSGAGDAEKDKAKQNAVLKAYGKKYAVPLDFEVYNEHGPFYPNLVNEDFIREITFSASQNVISASTPANMGYEITNIAIEYETVHSPELARQIEADYMNGASFLYDYVTYFKTQTTGADKTLNINVNIPRKSMKGVVVFFQKTVGAGEYESEDTSFQNPEIEDVQVTIEGLANKVYAQGFKPHQQWDEARRHFMTEDMKSSENTEIDSEEFYGNSKFALWLDLRSTEDGTLHGSGLRLVNTNDGVQLAITRGTTTAYSMHVFVVADAQLSIQNRQLHSIMF